MALNLHIVDDDLMQLEMLKDHFNNPAYSVKTFSNGEDFLANFKTDKPDAVVLDYNLNSASPSAMDGVSVLKKIKASDAGDKVDVVMFSGQDSIEVAVNSLSNDAFDYVVKGETAFHRLDSAFGKLARYKNVEGEAKRYRMMMFAFAFGMGALLVVALLARQLGLLSE